MTFVEVNQARLFSHNMFPGVTLLLRHNKVVGPCPIINIMGYPPTKMCRHLSPKCMRYYVNIWLRMLLSCVHHISAYAIML